MKKLILFLIISVFYSIRAEAAWENFRALFDAGMPNIETNINTGIYISSQNDGANTRTPGALLLISSAQGVIDEVIISSGGANSQLEIIDASLSTSTLLNGRRILNLDTSKTTASQFPQIIPLHVWCSSGIMINNGGDIPAKFSLIWRVK